MTYVTCCASSHAYHSCDGYLQGAGRAARALHRRLEPLDPRGLTRLDGDPRMTRDGTFEPHPDVTRHGALTEAMWPTDAHGAATLRRHRRRHLENLLDREGGAIDEQESVGKLQREPDVAWLRGREREAVQPGDCAAHRGDAGGGSEGKGKGKGKGSAE